MYVRDREIKEETEDQIVVTDNALTIGCVFWVLFLIVLELYCVGVGVVIGYHATVAERGGWFFAILCLFVILMYGYGTLETLHELLIKETIKLECNLAFLI